MALIPLAFVRCVAFGGVRVWRGSRRVGFHLPAAAWGALIECAGGLCPLTPLEHHLRPAIGAAGGAGGFIDHYRWRLLYPAGLTRGGLWTLGVGVLALNSKVYGVLRGRRRRRARSPRRRA